MAVSVFSLGGIGSPCCCGGTCGTCIPATNLSMTVAGVSGSGCIGPTPFPYNGTYTLVYSAAQPQWISGTITSGGAGGTGKAQITCRLDQTYLITFTFSVTGQLATTFLPQPANSCSIPIVSFSCSPFQMVLGPVVTCSIATSCYNWTSITIT